MPAKKKSRKSRLSSYLFLLINTVTWGLALVIVKPSLEFTTPFRYLLYRYLLAAIFSIPLLLYYWPKIKGKLAVIKKVFLVEFFGTGLALALLYIGLKQTTAIEASFLTTTTPIFVVLAGIFYLKEKEERHEWLGLMIAFLGTTLLTLFPIILNGITPNGLSLEGNILIVLGNIATAIAMVLAKKKYKKLPKLFVTSLSFYFGIFFFLVLSFFEIFTSLESASITQTMHVLFSTILVDFTYQPVWVAAGYMALFGSIIGLTAYIKGQDGIEASEASMFWYLQPFVFVPAGILFLGESVHPIQLLAMAIIFSGVFIAERRIKTRKV